MIGPHFFFEEYRIDRIGGAGRPSHAVVGRNCRRGGEFHPRLKTVLVMQERFEALTRGLGAA